MFAPKHVLILILKAEKGYLTCLRFLKLVCTYLYCKRERERENLDFFFFSSLKLVSSAFFPVEYSEGLSVFWFALPNRGCAFFCSMFWLFRLHWNLFQDGLESSCMLCSINNNKILSMLGCLIQTRLYENIF